MQVKICGITTKEAAFAAVDAGVDFIGFVFAESKRKVTPTQAKIIAEALPNHIKKVGVFVNETSMAIQEIVEFVHLDYVQLHGDETSEFAEQITTPIIKAFSISQDLEYPFPCDYYLIDSPKGPYRGGNGTAFDWQLLKDSKIARQKLILAGGLTEDNVEEAIRIVKPAVIDVSSGVETDGVKDTKKIKSFVKKAKQVFENL